MKKSHATANVLMLIVVVLATFFAAVSIVYAACPGKCQNSSTMGGGASSCDPPGYPDRGAIERDVSALRAARAAGPSGQARARQLEKKLKQCKDGADKCVGTATFSTPGGGSGSKPTCAEMPMMMMGMGMPMMMMMMKMEMMGMPPMLPMIPMPMPKMDMPMMPKDDECNPSFFSSFFDAQVPEKCKKGGVDPTKNASTTDKDLAKKIQDIGSTATVDPITGEKVTTDTGPKTKIMPLGGTVVNDDDEAALVFGKGGNTNNNVGTGSFGTGATGFGATGAGKKMSAPLGTGVATVISNLISGIAAGVSAIPQAIKNGVVSAAGAVEWLQSAATTLLAALTELNLF